MSVEAVPEQARANSAVLRVSAGPLAAPLLARLVAMMLTRAGCPVDRLDDAMLICDALAAHAPSQAIDGQLEFRVQTDADKLELRVSGLSAGGAEEIVRQTALPGIGKVLEPIVDELRIEPSAGEGPDELVLLLTFPAAETHS